MVAGLSCNELTVRSMNYIPIMCRMSMSCGQQIIFLGNVHDALTGVIAWFQTELCSSALTDVIHAVINGTDGCLFCFGHARLGECWLVLLCEMLLQARYSLKTSLRMLSHFFIHWSSYHLRRNILNCKLLLEHAVAQLVETLRYKPEGRGFDSRWCHCNFSLT
jgi:hypothetical protein